ncbi:hypothetical protein [Amycolatopsis sp. EV170708-02-1]|uniref:hypothetical protein n=1 Tax=Amycolatopsis sp. EV170708-02-1 TaxID=2919322 RepID=UPI001F0BC5F8|nr:hypothetical protein [Amycolatopsis sp. EV170708-02-1]UMP03429.1 hypothetical protein MJQ72_00635 [Amycolatopsis sp. EV170708-02-1]
MADNWKTINGNRVNLGSKNGGKVAAVAAGLVIAGVGGAGGLGALGGSAGSGAGAGAEALSGNTGGVADALPGRSLKTRRAEGRESAKRGNTTEAWGRLRFKELRRAPRKALRQADCVAAASDEVRDFLITTPCTSLDGMLLAVGDGHGNAAVISVVRVGFATKKRARDFEKVEAVQGSGDIRPFDVATALGITGVTMTGHHYHARPDGTAMVIAEADAADGRVDKQTLDALADVAAHLPVR